jgi:hypothetical protein
MGSQIFRALRPLVHAVSPTGPAGTADLYLWLHGLVGLAIGPNNIQILAPQKANDHVYRFGRAQSQDPLSTLQVLNNSHPYTLQVPGRPALPPRDPANFKTFVLNNVQQPNVTQSAFSLTVPYPDKIIGLRTTKIIVRPKPPQTTTPFGSGPLPLVVVLGYSNVDLQSVSITNLWTPPAGVTSPIHLHVYVEPNPSVSTMHDPQPDLDALVDMFPGQQEFIIKPSVAAVHPGVHECHSLTPVAAIPGVKVEEEMGIWEWMNNCNKNAPPAHPLTYEAGVCPPGMFLMSGVNWPLPPAHTNSKKTAKTKRQ